MQCNCVTAAQPEEQWKQMKTVLQETTAEVAGLSTRKHQDWFDEAEKEIQELIEKKCSCHSRLLAKPMIKLPRLHTSGNTSIHKNSCSTLQAKLRTMKNDWWTGLAERTQR